MTDSSRSMLRLALRLADPTTADALAERMQPELLAVLADRFGLPEEMVEQLLGGDAAQMRAALTIDPAEWLMGAAELGDPDVGLALWRAEYRHDTGPTSRAVLDFPDLLATVVSHGDYSDSRWFAKDGLFTDLCEVGGGQLLVPVLTSGLVGVDTLALAVFARHLPPPVVVDACLGLLEIWGGTGGFTEFLSLLERIPTLDPGHPWLPDLMRQAIDAPDPESFLREHRPAGEWSDPEHLRALVEIRYGDRVTAKPDGLDWELIRREHQRLPFARKSRGGPWGESFSPLLRLARWEGCPADLVKESGRDSAIGNPMADELPFEALTVPGVHDEIHLGYHLKEGISEGRYSVDRVLAEVSPAMEVLEALSYDHEPTRKALAGLLARLGTDPANWLTCYARMGRCQGSVVDLVEDVTAPASRKKRRTTWPWSQPAQFPVEFVENARAAFLTMFRCVPEEIQKAVIPHLDLRAVQHFLVYGEPSPHIRDAVVAAHGLRAQVAMAAGHPRSGEQLDYLLDLDEPGVDAQLFRHAYHLDRAERQRLLAGRLRGGGTRPVPHELLEVLEDLTIDGYRDRFIAGVDSGDLGVARIILRRLRLYLPATRLRLLTAVWERGGPDAVREILALDRLPVTLRRRAEKLLDAPDGLNGLRGLLAEAESPAALLAYLAKPGGDPAERLHRLRAEGLAPPWPALVAAQRADGLPADVVRALVDDPECPRELLLAGLGTGPAAKAEWLRSALEHGTLTPGDLLTCMAPARKTIGRLRSQNGRHQDPGDWQLVRDRAAALAREHLGTDAEAWAVCLQLLPTFAGTLPELVETAGAMTRSHL